MVVTGNNNRRNDSTTTTTISPIGGNEEKTAVDCESALLKTEYGAFNVYLFLATLPAAWTALFDITSAAFILASAECDLELTLFRKGVLVAVPFIGMLSTVFFWDFAENCAGKRVLIQLGILIDVVLNISSTLVNSYYLFLLFKFCTGIVAGGPFTLVGPYLSEFHAAKYKVPFARWSGLIFSLGTIIPAALAMTILPNSWTVLFFGREYNIWRIYLLICSIPCVIGLISTIFLPESPKHLLAAGRADEALIRLQAMYSMNLGKPRSSFPIKALLPAEEQATEQLSAARKSLEKMKVEWHKTKALLGTSYLLPFCLLSTIQFGSMLGFHTMRLWVPHLFIILNNFDWDTWKNVSGEVAPTMCQMLDFRNAIPARDYLDRPDFDDLCISWNIDPSIYRNSTIIATSAVLTGFLVGFILTVRWRKKALLITAFLLSMASSFGMNWAQAPPYMLTLASMVIVTMRVAGNIVLGLNVDLLPANLRLTSSSILTTIGNLGAIVGNFIFPALLEFDCLSSYMGFGIFFLLMILPVLLVPGSERKLDTT